MEVACTLLPYIDFMYGVLPLREWWCITWLRRGAIRSKVAARKECAEGTNPSRLKDEPKRGFISIRFFRNRASFKVSFSSGEDGLILFYRFFKASRLPLHPKKMRDERLLLSYNFFVGKAISIRIFGRALTGFFSIQFFRKRQARKNQTTT